VLPALILLFTGVFTGGSRCGTWGILGAVDVNTGFVRTPRIYCMRISAEIGLYGW
jgi:hypothetical protein